MQPTKIVNGIKMPRDVPDNFYVLYEPTSPGHRNIFQCRAQADAITSQEERLQVYQELTEIPAAAIPVDDLADGTVKEKEIDIIPSEIMQLVQDKVYADNEAKLAFYEKLTGIKQADVHPADRADLDKIAQTNPQMLFDADDDEPTFYNVTLKDGKWYQNGTIDDETREFFPIGEGC